jgi:hypothetical protein
MYYILFWAWLLSSSLPIGHGSKSTVVYSNNSRPRFEKATPSVPANRVHVEGGGNNNRTIPPPHLAGVVEIEDSAAAVAYLRRPYCKNHGGLYRFVLATVAQHKQQRSLIYRHS